MEEMEESEEMYSMSIKLAVNNNNNVNNNKISLLEKRSDSATVGVEMNMMAMIMTLAMVTTMVTMVMITTMVTMVMITTMVTTAKKR